MIEHVIYPSDVSTLKNYVQSSQDQSSKDQKASLEKSFYLELFGETAPGVDMNFAQVFPGGPASEASAHETLLDGYQYWWTLGLATEACAPGHHIFSLKRDDDVLKKDVHVVLYFPTQGGWRIKEILPSVLYLKPLHEQAAAWHHLFSKGEELAPVLSTFTGTASLSRLLTIGARASAVPPLEAASLIPLMMSIFARMHVNTVPPNDEFPWFADKTSFYHQEFGLMQGIEWTIPAKMFHALGRRLTGSLTVTFLPSYQQTEQPMAEVPEFRRCPILAKAFIGDETHSIALPSEHDEFLMLYIKPVPAPAIQPGSAPA